MRDTFLLLVVDLGSFFGGVCVGGVGSMFLDYCCVTCVWNLSRRGNDARRSLQLFSSSSSSSLCAMLLCDDEIPDTVLGPLSYICHMYFVVPAPSLSPFLEQPTISVLFGVLGCAAMLGALPFLFCINHVAFATVPYCCWRWYFRICPLSMYEKSPPESSRPPSRHGSPVLPTILAPTLPIPLHQPKPC